MNHTVFYILAGLAFVFGFLIFIASMRQSKSGTGMVSDEVAHKDGVPIMPRHKRHDDVAADKTDEMVVNINEGMTDKIDIDTAKVQAEHDALSNLAAAASLHTGEHKKAHSDETGTEVDTPKAQAQTAAPKESARAHEIPVQHQFDNRTQVNLTEQSPMLDEYFDEQEALESLRNNDALINHKRNLTIMITPQNSFGLLSGKKVLELAKTYALKYGIMNMFHRYEQPDGTGMLWFSVLGVTHEGIVAFDLNTMMTENYRGLALFLSLPHPQAVKGFDSMAEVARDMAEMIQGDLHDEKGFLIDDKQLMTMRTIAEQHQI